MKTRVTTVCYDTALECFSHGVQSWNLFKAVILMTWNTLAFTIVALQGLLQPSFTSADNIVTSDDNGSTFYPLFIV